MPKSPKLIDHPYAQVDCPTCRATVGHWCKRPSGHSGPMVEFHAARRKLAEEQVAAEAGNRCAEAVVEGLKEFYPGLEDEQVCQKLVEWLVSQYEDTGNSQADYVRLRDLAEKWMNDLRDGQ